MVELLQPESLAEASAIVRARGEDAKFLGGGTALILLRRMGLIGANTLVGLRRVGDVPGWAAIGIEDDHLVVGGSVTLTEVAASPLVRDHAPSFARAAGVVGNLRVRNVATVAGALAEADYASDPPPVLIALNAEVIASTGDQSRTIPVAQLIIDFYTTALEPSEVITGLRIPVAEPDRHSVYLKFGSRSEEDRPCVGVAATARLDGATVRDLTVVIGAIAAVGQQFPDVCTEVLGAPLDAEAREHVAQAYAEQVDPIDDVRGSAWYRKQVVRAQVRRALEQLAEAGGGR